jgi:2-desacetyl-2-hydroxyethyl bacteriochlorophyllide A dehydrogenase
MSERRRFLQFDAPRAASVGEESLEGPGEGEVLLRSECSGVSAGSELLLYRGEAPEGIALDESLPSLEGTIRYPLRYGYALVGRVAALGKGVDRMLLGRRAFVFHPHASHTVVKSSDLLILPEEIPPQRGVFLPNLETAINLLLDGAPLLGERVAVFGLGVVGLLTTLLLSRMLRGGVVGVEPQGYRRDLTSSLAPDALCLRPDALELPQLPGKSEEYGAMQEQYPGFDLVYELSGRPETLNEAIGATGFGGRIVLGSWYGTKRAPLELGGRFHRARLKVISSQVSTLAPEWSGRWNKARRMDTALRLLQELPLERLVTHQIAFGDAPEAFRRLAEGEPGLMQLVFRYEEG